MLDDADPSDAFQIVHRYILPIVSQCTRHLMVMGIVLPAHMVDYQAVGLPRLRLFQAALQIFSPPPNTHHLKQGETCGMPSARNSNQTLYSGVRLSELGALSPVALAGGAQCIPSSILFRRAVKRCFCDCDTVSPECEEQQRARVRTFIAMLTSLVKNCPIHSSHVPFSCVESITHTL